MMGMMFSFFRGGFEIGRWWVREKRHGVYFVFGSVETVIIQQYDSKFRKTNTLQAQSKCLAIISRFF